MANKLVIKNTSMLYVMNIAKMVFPLVTLPYLTRVLSVDCYGTVAYVKAIMQYMQIVVDFGFLLSGTRDIVKVRTDKFALNKVVGDVFLAKLIMGVIAYFLLLILELIIPMLRSHLVYVNLAFLSVFLTIFLFDYIFRGIEEMEVITLRFVLMKTISTTFTFLFVKGDGDYLWIPILDIFGTLFAIILVIFELQKREIRLVFNGFKSSLCKIKESFVFFISDIATTAFLALNTVIIGMLLSETEVAYWSVCLQLVGAVLSLYSPISNGIYPYMVKHRDISMINRTMRLFMPIVIMGCIITFFISEWVLRLVGGVNYVAAAPVLRSLTAVLLFGFPSVIYGWPVLGAIGKERENTTVTICVAIIQVLGLGILAAIDYFNLVSVALLRSFTELLLFIGRFYFYKKYSSCFVSKQE